MKFSICSDMILWGVESSKAVEQLHNLGVDTVEFWDFTNKNIPALKEAVDACSMQVSGFCVDSSDPGIKAKIIPGLFNSPDKEDFFTALRESVGVAKTLGAKFLIIPLGNQIDGLSYEEQMANIKANLLYVKDYLEREQIMLVLEPIHAEERPTYIEPRIAPTLAILKEVDSPMIKLLYDIYHQGWTGDYSPEALAECVPYIGHIHIADCPDRHEPGTGSIDFAAAFKALRDAGYGGYIGIECVPTKDFAIILKELHTLWGGASR